MKELRDSRFPTAVRTPQQLTDNTKRFWREGWGEWKGGYSLDTPPTRSIKRTVWMDYRDENHINNFWQWITGQEESKDQHYLKYRDASWQKLRDNAARLKKEPEVMNLILLRKRNETQLVETKYEEDLPEENHETSININNNDTDNNGVVDE